MIQLRSTGVETLLSPAVYPVYSTSGPGLSSLYLGGREGVILVIWKGRKMERNESGSWIILGNKVLIG